MQDSASQNYYKDGNKIYEKKIPKNYFEKNKIRPLLKNPEKYFQRLNNSSVKS